MIVNSKMFDGQKVKLVENVKLGELAALLKNDIKSRTDCFETVNVVFPNDNLAQWFKVYWLSTESDVLMNVRFTTLEEYLYQRLDSCKGFEKAKRYEIRTVIIKCILLLEEGYVEKKISDYLYDGDAINGVRLFDLANSLSELFCSYEKDAFKITGWQKVLYEMVMEQMEDHGISTFARVYEKAGSFRPSQDSFILFGFNEIDDVYVAPLKKLSEQNRLIVYALRPSEETKINLEFLAAPSRIREIEAVHTKICSLVKNEGAKLNDFLVLSSDTSAYERDIGRVFSQDNESFPNVPFNISSKKRHETDVTDGLKKLFEIGTKGFFTRSDFAGLINNKAIQKARDITSENVDEWQQSILAMNVFRNGKKTDDWDYAKKRLVLSKVADLNSSEHNIVELNDGSYMPYTRIALDDDSVIKIIEIIDDLQAWISLFEKTAFLSVNRLNALKNQLIRWFSSKDFDGVESNGVLLKLLSELNFWRNFGMDNDSVPLNTLFYSLFDRSHEMNIKTSSLFVDGVTFVDYDERAVLEAKYIFFIGASSKNFPPLERKSEIDLRPETDLLPQQYLNFESQCYNATCKIYFSYVNQNLKTDEEYFPSSFLAKLFEKQSFKIDGGAKIGIDETRPWASLFTKKEYKEKNYYIGLFRDSDVTEVPSTEIVPDSMKKVTVSQMKDFLSEPLKYKFEHLFGRADETDDLMEDEYEPIELDALTKSILVKSALNYWMKNPDAPLFDESGQVNYPLAKEIFKRFLLEHKVPDVTEELSDIQVQSVFDDVRETKNNINAVLTADGVTLDYEITKIKDYHFVFGGEDVLMMYNNELCRAVKDNERKYIELSSACVKADFSRLLPMYICALMDVASLKDDTEYQIEIHRGKSATLSLTPQKAKEQISKIYQSMNSFELNAYMPLDKINQKTVRNFEKLIEDAMSPNGSWRYFKEKNMFNPKKDLGYTRYNFNARSSQVRALLRDLVLYVGPEPETEEEK